MLVLKVTIVLVVTSVLYTERLNCTVNQGAGDPAYFFALY